MVSAQDMMSREFAAIDESEQVSSILGKLQSNTPVCVVGNGEFSGIFSPHRLLTSRADITKLKLAKVTVPVPQPGPESDLLEIAALMYDANAALLPVVKDGKILGVVHALEVLKRLHELPELRGLQVRNIRHPHPITIREDESIDTALSIMHDHHIERLPVVDDKGRISGFLSYKDLLQNYYGRQYTRDFGEKPHTQTRAFRAERPDVPQLPVSNVMYHGDILNISEDDTVQKAIEQMVLHNVHSLVTLADNRPTHIITKRDILEAAVNSQVQVNPSIQYVGLEELDIDSFLKLHVQRIASRQMERLQHYFNNEYQLILHIKEHQKTGERHKYSVHMRLVYPGATVPATKSVAWDIRTAMQEAFSKLESKLGSKYKRNKKEVPSLRRQGRELP
jgi:CBS domain-containing protein/ribosome-associated translation inhibitor RaiA